MVLKWTEEISHLASSFLSTVSNTLWQWKYVVPIIKHKFFISSATFFSISMNVLSGYHKNKGKYVAGLMQRVLGWQLRQMSHFRHLHLEKKPVRDFAHSHIVCGSVWKRRAREEQCQPSARTQWSKWASKKKVKDISLSFSLAACKPSCSILHLHSFYFHATNNPDNLPE